MVEWVRKRRKKREKWRKKIEARDVEIQQQERYEKVQRSRWNS